MSTDVEVPLQAQHRLTVGSILDPPVHKMLEGVTVPVMYCDPPWDDGKMKYFATLATKQTGKQHTPVTWRQFMQALVDMIRNHVDGWVFIEMGGKMVDQTHAYLEQALVEVEVHDSTYRTGDGYYPSKLLVGHTSQHSKGVWVPDPSFLKGGLKQAVGCTGSVGKPGEIVLDPSCGCGFTARAAVKNRMVFYGNEFSAHRAAATRKILEKG